MAITLAYLQTVLNQVFSPMIADQLNQRAELIRRLPKTVGGGKNIAWDAKVARGTSAGSYASGATITGDDNDTEVPAVLQWKRFKAEFKVTGDAVAAAASGGPQAFVDLLGKAMRDATQNLAVKLGSQSYGDGTGNGGLDMDGLGAIVAATGTYATIARSGGGSYATWQSNVLANGGTPRALTVDLMRSAERAAYKAAGVSPDFIITTPEIYSKYEGLFESLRRVMGDQTLDYGGMELAFKGIPVVRDIHCPAGKMYFLNRESITFEQLPVIPTQDGIELTQGALPMLDAEGNVGLQVGIEMLGKDGDSYKGFVKLYGNMKGEHPNRNAVVADIDES